VETLRGLLLGGTTQAVAALTWCAAILVASVAASGWLFRRRTG
jgi:hypothetical protein